MGFNLILPSIIELYINTLTLHLLQEELDTMGLDDLTDEMRNTVDEVSNEFSISAQIAEELFGSPDIVQGQLNVLTSNIGES
jgi:hypothetical protein